MSWQVWLPWGIIGAFVVLHLIGWAFSAWDEYTCSQKYVDRVHEREEKRRAAAQAAEPEQPKPDPWTDPRVQEAWTAVRAAWPAWATPIEREHLTWIPSEAAQLLSTLTELLRRIEGYHSHVLDIEQANAFTVARQGGVTWPGDGRRPVPDVRAWLNDFKRWQIRVSLSRPYTTLGAH